MSGSTSASRSETALDNAVAAVSTPGSPSYRHYITPAQFRAQYGPAPDAAPKVSAWLRSAGLTVSALQDNGRYFDVTGSVTDAQRAFGTQLSLYRRAGGTYQAPSEPVTVPSNVSQYVLSVLVSTSRRPPPRRRRRSTCCPASRRR